MMWLLNHSLDRKDLFNQKKHGSISLCSPTSFLDNYIWISRGPDATNSNLVPRQSLPLQLTCPWYVP